MSSRQIIMDGEVDDTFSYLKRSETLEELFSSPNSNFEDVEKINIIVQNAEIDTISGIINISYDGLPNKLETYFRIILKPFKTSIPKTEISLDISDEPFTFTPQYQKQEKKIKQSQSRNLNRIAMVAAIALVAVTIPTVGIFAPDILDIKTTTVTLSDTETRLYFSEKSNTVGNHRDAIYYADKILQDEQVNIGAAIQIREAYSHLERYDTLLPQKTSLITIESSDNVIFYPDKDKAGYAIPKENDSFKMDYPGDIPIVYPTNGKYPIVMFNEDSNYSPAIISPDSPNYSKILSSSSQDQNMVQPILRVNTEDNNITYAETPIGGLNDPLVVYPYGFGKDMPVIVFPSQESAATTLTNNYAPRENYLVYGEQSIVTSDDLVPLEYTEISPNDIRNIQNDNSPIRVSPEGPDSLSVKFPLGIDSRPLINYVPSGSIVTTTQNTAGSVGTTTQNTAGSMLNPTFVVTTQRDSDIHVDDSPVDTSRIDNDASSPNTGGITDDPNVATSIDNDASGNTIDVVPGFDSIGCNGNSSCKIQIAGNSVQGGGSKLMDGSNGLGNLQSNGGNFVPNFAKNNGQTTNISNEGVEGTPTYQYTISSLDLESNLLSKSDKKILEEPLQLAWSEQNYANMDLTISQGDPNIFTIDDTIQPCTIKMYPDQDESYHWKFDLFATDIPLKMDRTLCEGTYMMFVDFNGNGIMDDGYEALWHTDYTTYQIMHIIDYEKGNDNGNHNGRIDVNDDDIWQDVRVMDSDYQTYRPSELGIAGFDYIGEIIMADDNYGPGQYADIAGVAEKNFRIVSWNPEGLIFDDGTTRTTYGALQGPLLDCTIYDARYMIAEKHLSEWELATAMNLYEEGLEYCKSMEFTSEDPDKLLSHWVAGIASYYHRDGQLEKAKPYYEDALEMSPDRHFYLTDYALLLDQLGYDSSVTLPIVEKALEIDPDHGYAITVKDRILSQ